LLSEKGIINQGITRVREQLPLIVEDAENGLTDLSRELFAEQYEKLNPYLTRLRLRPTSHGWFFLTQGGLRWRTGYDTFSMLGIRSLSDQTYKVNI
jgi:hypothetical protein